MSEIKDGDILIQTTTTWAKFKIGNSEFLMKEMTIRRVKEFIIIFSSAIDKVKDITGVDDLKDLDLDDAIVMYADALTEILTDLFNFVFEYKNEEYEKVGIDWVADNISIGMVMTIGKTLATLCRLDWLGPFLKSRLMTAAVGMTKGTQ